MGLLDDDIGVFVCILDPGVIIPLTLALMPPDDATGGHWCTATKTVPQWDSVLESWSATTTVHILQQNPRGSRISIHSPTYILTH